MTPPMTPLIRTLSLAAATIASMLSVGCQTNETTATAALAPQPESVPVFADTAQPVRDYPQSVSYIQNGDTEDDGSVGFRYRSRDNIHVGLEPVAEVGVFAANVVTLPYTLIAERDKEHVSTGLQIPPTFTAMPALPDSPSQTDNIDEVPTGVKGEAAGMTEPQPAVTSPDNASGTDAMSPTMTPEPMTPSPTAEAAAVASETPATVLSRTTTDNNAPSFSIVGQVTRPGTYDVADLTLTQIVAAAGPSTEDKSKVRIQIDRPGEESAVTTLADLLKGDVDDVKIKAGDVVTVSVTP